MTVGIIGLGLIGGSIGLALREPGNTIVGTDPSPEACKIATTRFCVDHIVSEVEVAKSDIVFVAAPPSAVVSIVENLLAHKGPKTVITDCASVKAEIVAWAKAEGIKEFVPGHPMAGHEKNSAAFASAWMFRGAKWLLSPGTATASSAVRAVESAVKQMGAVPVRVSAELHDRQVAVMSHLPHVMAGLLIELADSLERTDAAAGSWRDLTRVGGANPDLWTEILMGNRAEVARVLVESELRFAGLRAALDEGDSEAIRDFFERARISKQRQEA